MAGRSIQRFRLLASAARTATTTVTPPANRYLGAVLLTLNVSVASGTGGLTLAIKGIDPISGNAINLLLDGAAIIATGTYGFLVHPTAGAASAGIRVAAARPLSQDWQVVITHGDGSSYTYSLSAELYN